MQKTIFVAALTLLLNVLKAQHADELHTLMQKAGIPGLSLAYVKNGHLLESYTLGVTSHESFVPVNDSTVFSAASLSKSIFAYLVFQLVQEKKLDPDRPLNSYYRYPDVAGDTRSEKVTARMILQHASGLPNWRDDDSLHFRFDPGIQFNYSGEGMVWLSRVVEAIVKTDIASYAKEKIFRPLGMRHTSYIWQNNFGDNYAYPHIDNARSMNKYFPDQPNVAQSLQTTATDYAIFLAKALEDKKFMKAFARDPVMRINDQLSWGWGLGHQLVHEELSFWQWGDNGTFKAFLIGYPAKKEGLVYFANSFHGLKIAKDILAIYFPMEQPALAWLNSGSADAADLQVFEAAITGSVNDALKDYRLPGTTRIDTSRLSLAQLGYLGNRFIQLREFDKAIDFFKAALQTDSTNAKSYAGLAEAWLKRGDGLSARKAYERAALLAPGMEFYRGMVSKLNHTSGKTEPGKKLVVFRLPEYMSAHHVSLAGSFNGWSDLAEPMHWENGAWVTTVSLAPGHYKYKFIVDGVWLMDTRNPKFSTGSFDSELDVGE